MSLCLVKGGFFMPISEKLLDYEKKYLKICLKEIGTQIKKLGSNLQVEQVDVKESRKFIWENRGSMDPVEISSNMMASEQEYYTFERHANYLKKLYRVQNNPYFGRIDFTEDDTNTNYIVYIGITHLTNGNYNLIYDWRAPISSLFYDYELGKAQYTAPAGIIKGSLIKKRQYKIKDGELVHIFDNDINVTDEFLQEVLANASND
jgi:DNA helicase-2/ATP-dependent DNA helicase PcrA